MQQRIRCLSAHATRCAGPGGLSLSWGGEHLLHLLLRLDIRARGVRLQLAALLHAKEEEGRGRLLRLVHVALALALARPRDVRLCEAGRAHTLLLEIDSCL